MSNDSLLCLWVCILKWLPDLWKGSGWTGALTETEIATSGSANSFLSASDVAKTRQAHQITAASLYSFMKTAFYDSVENAVELQERKAFIDWCCEREAKVPQFQFWSTVFNLEILFFCFIRAYRESDFELYKESLSEIIPYIFALDHINYARWLPVHPRDMLALEYLHPDIYTEFARVNFAIRKTDKVFSNIAIDQAQEQNNAAVKGDGGAIGLTKDTAALRTWMVAGPEISRLVDEFSSTSGNPSAKRNITHHEDISSIQKEFLEKKYQIENHDI